MEEKKNKKIQKLNNQEICRASGGRVEEIVPGKIWGAINPKKIGTGKVFKSRKDAEEYNKKMGWD